MTSKSFLRYIEAMFLSVLLFTACSTDNDPQSAEETSPAAQQAFAYTMHLDCAVPLFGVTRSFATWPQHSVIYLRFLTEDTEITGKAQYHSTDDTWEVITDEELPILTEEYELTAYYFDGSQNVNGDVPTLVDLTPETGIYASEGQYTHPTPTEIYVKTKLQPLVWRLSFRGTAGQTVALTGSKNDIYYPKSYDTEYGDIEYAEWDWSLTVGDNGSTPYVYGWLSSTSENVLCVTTDADYQRIIKYSDLTSGNSVYCQVPTASNYQAEGWTRVEE